MKVSIVWRLVPCGECFYTLFQLIFFMMVNELVSHSVTLALLLTRGAIA